MSQLEKLFVSVSVIVIAAMIGLTYQLLDARFDALEKRMEAVEAPD